MVRIAQATPHDFPDVRSLFLEYIEWIIPKVETIWGYSVPITAAEAVERDMAEIGKFMPPDGRLFLASADTNVLGCACARTIRPGLAEIKRVYVRPNQRGSRTGRALIETIIADLRDAGYTTVRLETAPFMAAAEKLYRSLGFTDIAPYDESEVPEDVRHHSIFMELSL